MIRVLFALALLALAAPSNAATVMACQDINGSDWPVSPQHPCPTTDVGPGGGSGATGVTMTNKSGTIAAGGATNQIAIAANPNRVSCHIQPQTTDIFINPATTAPLSASSEYATVLTEFTCPAGYKGAVAVSGLTTGATYYGDEGTVP